MGPPASFAHQLQYYLGLETRLLVYEAQGGLQMLLNVQGNILLLGSAEGFYLPPKYPLNRFLLCKCSFAKCLL